MVMSESTDVWVGQRPVPKQKVVIEVQEALPDDAGAGRMPLQVTTFDKHLA